DDHAVGGAHRLARRADIPWAHADLGAFAEEQIHHFVGDAVADLVRMAFGNAFRREKIVLPHRAKPLFWKKSGATFCKGSRSTTSSEMRSLTLSGWPSETLSDVKR